MLTRARIALIGAAASAAVLVLVGVVALGTHFGGRVDQSAFLGFAELQRPRVNGLANLIAHLCDPLPFLGLAAVAVAIGFVRGRARLALAAGTILVGANITTEVLKHVLAGPRANWMFGGWYEPVGPASWPSGHATAAMSLTLAFVLVSPARLRPLVAALGAAFAVAVCFSFLTLGWHYPSDVLGGYLVAATCAQLALAGLLRFDARPGRAAAAAAGQPLSLRAALIPPLAALLAAGMLAGLAALARPHAVIAYAQQHKTFVVGAMGIAALGLALATAVMLGVRATQGSRRSA